MKTARRIRAGLMLCLVFIWDLVIASFGVARVVLSRRIQTKPAIAVVPVAVQRPWAVAMFAYFTSLTPGSTCLHVSHDRSRLYVHLLDTTDPDAAAMRFKRLYERWIQELEA